VPAGSLPEADGGRREKRHPLEVARSGMRHCVLDVALEVVFVNVPVRLSASVGDDPQRPRDGRDEEV